MFYQLVQQQKTDFRPSKKIRQKTYGNILKSQIPAPGIEPGPAG